MNFAENWFVSLFFRVKFNDAMPDCLSPGLVGGMHVPVDFHEAFLLNDKTGTLLYSGTDLCPDGIC